MAALTAPSSSPLWSPPAQLGQAPAAGAGAQQQQQVQVLDLRHLGELGVTAEEEKRLERWRDEERAACSDIYARGYANLGSAQPTARLNNGHTIPLVGLGTWYVVALGLGASRGVGAAGSLTCLGSFPCLVCTHTHARARMHVGRPRQARCWRPWSPP